MAEINQFLSAEAQKEVQAYIASLETIAGQYKNIATASLKLEDAKQAELKTEQELLKTQQQSEILAQKKIKTQKDEAIASERLEKAAKKEEEAIKKQNSAYAQLNEAHKKSLATAKQLGVIYGTNSKQFKDAAKQANKYGDELKLIDSRLGNNQRNVGNYSGAIKKAFSSMSGSVMGFIGLALNPLSIGIAAVAGAVKLIGGNIMENQSIMDKWQVAVKSSKAVLDVLSSALIGNYKGLDGLNDRMKEAVAMVELLYEQYQKLDKEELKEARRINQLSIAIEAYKKQASDMTLTEKQREDASNTAYFKEIELLNLQMSLAKERAVLYKTELSIQEESGKEISNEQKRTLNEYLIAYDNAKAKIIFLEQDYRKKQREIDQKANEERKKEEEDYAKGYQKILDEERDLSIKMAQSRLDEDKKNKEDKIKLDQEYDEAYIQILEDERAFEKKKLDEGVEATKEAERKKQEARQQAIDMSIQMVDMLFSYQQTRLDAEMKSIERYYETRINAASNAGEDTQALEREYEIKRAEMDIKIAKSKRRQAILDVAIATAVNTTKAGLEPWLIPFLITLGALQTAVIMAQPLPEVPAFATGTMDSPSTFIAGEKGREIGITKDGKPFITPNKATLYKDMPGTKIIPNELSELVLKDIGTNAIERKLDKVITAIEKQQTNVYIDKSLSRSVNLKHIRSKHGRN